MAQDSDIELARNTIRIERDALEQLEAGIGPSIAEAADLIMATDRHIIVAGVGKSGHIGQKIAASLASTGTPSFFLHPTEASHGDLGMVVPGSVVIAISYSGESRELVDLLRYCRGNNIPLIGMTRSADSTLGRSSDVILLMPTVTEACPNGLAPTSSTTMALALGDALTIVLMARRGFSREEFGFRHPGGKLGRSLQTVGDYIDGRPAGDMPIVSAGADVHDVILAVSEGRKGCVGVTDAGGTLVGMITDGDIRRAMLAGKLSGAAGDIMTANPSTLTREMRMSAVVKGFTERRISNAFVTADGKPVGLVDMKDLLAEGYV